MAVPKENIHERLTFDGSITADQLCTVVSQYDFAASFIKGKLTLDIACGNGFGVWYLKRKGAMVIGGDISMDALKSSKQFCQDEDATDFVVMDATKLPFASKTLAAIVSIETLEHLPDHDKFLGECQRVLKEEGIFICSTPNRQVSAYVGGRSVNPYHINELSPKELEGLLNKYFCDVQLLGHDYWLRGNIFEKKMVELLRKTIFRIYKLRQLAHFMVRLTSRQSQPVRVVDKSVCLNQHLDKRYKPFYFSGSARPAGLFAVAKCTKTNANILRYSVVIPTKDRIDDLTRCIQSLESQSVRPMEIIIVDGSITQQTREMISEMSGKHGIPLKYIRQTVGKFGRAKNIGAMQAKGDVVLFVDDDVILDEYYIEELDKVYQKDTAGVIGAVQGICANIEPYGHIKTAYCRLFMLGGWHGTKSKLNPSGTITTPVSLSGTIKAAGFVGSAHSFRKHIFNEFQFDEIYEYGDELNFSVRVSRKYCLYVTPFAKFIHNQSPVGRNFEEYQINNTYARYHMFCKLMPQTLINRICFGWSLLGAIIGYIGVYIGSPTEANREYAMGSIKGTVLILRSVIHRKDVP
ncbi:MAG: glycosyltransferase [Dehalococcoidales bacterium]|nr:glycosyltransferase [Dehalococcoidales bacterium]